MVTEINYSRWRKLITRIQIILVIMIFIVEAVGNMLLYQSRTQGYGPDTIVVKLLRYLVLTTATNLFFLIAAQIIVKKYPKHIELQKYTLILSTVFIFGNVAYSHYQFTDTFTTFAIAVTLTMLYEDKRLCMITTIVSAVLLLICCIARGLDGEYNRDIGSEAAIAYGVLAAFYVITRLCVEHLQETRRLLNESLIHEEEAKYAMLLEKKNVELQQLTTEVIEAFAKAVDFNDPYTAGHSRRVGQYSRMIAERLGLSAEECENIYYVGLLHDVGKLGIDNSIINKPNRLSTEEFTEIKKHPMMGYEILKGISLRDEYGLGARYHHERPDGKGYPQQISDIPFVGRIISVADAYDAMTSKRPYRDALAQDVVRRQLLDNAGTQFDRKIVDVMVQMIDEDTDYELRQKEDEAAKIT